LVRWKPKEKAYPYGLTAVRAALRGELKPLASAVALKLMTMTRVLLLTPTPSLIGVKKLTPEDGAGSNASRLLLCLCPLGEPSRHKQSIHLRQHPINMNLLIKT
jgi:hypothetical protein